MEIDYTVLLLEIGSRIRALRKQYQWSQEQLADRASLDRTYVGAVERGERNLAAINLFRIAKTLECEVGDLFPKINDISDIENI